MAVFNINDIFASVYYVRMSNGKISGPFSICDLLFIGVNANTPVGIGGYQSWTPAGEIPGMMNKFHQMVETIGRQPKRITHHKNSEKSPAFFSRDKFYYKDLKGKIYGSFSIFDLSIMGIGEHDQISVNNYTDWMDAGAIPDLLAVVDELLISIDPKSKLDVEKLLSPLKDFMEKYLSSKDEEANPGTRLISKTICEYNDAIKAFSSLCNKYEEELSSLKLRFGDSVFDITNKIVSEIKDIVHELDKKKSLLSQNQYEIIPVDSHIWEELPASSENTPVPLFYVGSNIRRLDYFENGLVLEDQVFEHVLDKKHIVAYYDALTERHCLAVISTMICRMFMACKPKKFRVLSLDPVNMEGISPLFKALPDSVYRQFSNGVEIQNHLLKAVDNAQQTIQKDLLYPMENIGEYNRIHPDNPKAYQFIVVKGFPVGFSTTAVNCLKTLFKSGHRAGINVILLVDKDELGYSDLSKRIYDSLEVDRFASTTIKYDFASGEYPYPGNFEFSILSMLQIQSVVNCLNASLNVKPVQKKYHYGDYMPDENLWWKESGLRSISMPFGVNPDNGKIVGLAITQENAQNAAIVVGRPGTGKSVFLHDIITFSAMKYPPTELEYYLIDFSGVEFDIYAQSKLPHAKVIAPEAEREFGLSVLRAILEEAYRREKLLRENHVNNIVDLNAVNPNVNVPRIIVIIDEFQSLFERENDKISREASSIIQQIVKKYRKLAINLIMATQKISEISNSILPRDLIGNRIVFNPTPSDADLIGMMSDPPVLEVGECVYNDMAGVKARNIFNKSFYIPHNEQISLLDRIRTHFENSGLPSKDTMVFRSNELPKLYLPKVLQKELPEKVNICFGSPFALSDIPVSATICQRNNNNILIIGGDAEVAERIAIYSAMSAMNAYTDHSASFYFFNFMRPRDPLCEMPEHLYSSAPFDIHFAVKETEVLEFLKSIAAEIFLRQQGENVPHKHIYISIYAFELAQMFKMGGRRGDDVSESGQILNLILKNGPLVGVFTILQVDLASSLYQLGRVEKLFTHRVVLQLSESDSRYMMNDSDVASHLFVPNRPYTRYLAFYFNPTKSIQEKFKPFK